MLIHIYMPMKTHGNSTHMHADARQHIIQSHSTAAHINILTYYGSMITHMTSASTEQYTQLIIHVW